MGLTSVLGGILFFGLVQAAPSATLAWDRAPSHTNLSAFVLKYGVTSGSYTGQVSVAGNTTTATVNNLTPGVTYYFVVTAKDAADLESDPSNQFSYSVPVAGINLPPTLNPISNVTVSEDAGLQTISLTGVTDGALNEIQTVTVTTVSSNPSLVPNPAVTYASPNSTGTLRFTPVTNGFGTATITVTVNDGAAVNNLVTRSFVVVVNPVNEAPTLNALNNLTINRNAGSQTVNLSGITSGAANEFQTLTITTVSSNPSLIPNPAVTYTSPNSTGTLRFTPVTNGLGSATITVTANDGAALNNLVTRSFTVTVNSASLTPLVRARVTPARQVILTVTGQVGHTHEVLSSQDLITWSVVATVTLGASGTVELLDANAASRSRRFYRVRDTQP